MKRALTATIAFTLVAFPGRSQEKAIDPDKVRILKLIDQLAIAVDDGMQQSLPTVAPEFASDVDAEYEKAFEKCNDAFLKLKEFGEDAFPHLLDHLDDKRQSIPFRNHHLDQSVGAACYTIIESQLCKLPENYSDKYSRVGRDGTRHISPSWKGSPFDEDGGLKNWIRTNSKLGYSGMQIKCLEWYLRRETAIGIFEPAAYFDVILPLEVAILEKRAERGEKVGEQIEQLKVALNRRNPAIVPSNLLPIQEPRQIERTPESSE